MDTTKAKCARLGRNILTTYERIGETAKNCKVDQKKAQMQYSQIPFTGRRMYKETWSNLYGESKEYAGNVSLMNNVLIRKGVEQRQEMEGFIHLS